MTKRLPVQEPEVVTYQHEELIVSVAETSAIS